MTVAPPTPREELFGSTHRWPAASAWQGCHPDLSRPRLLRLGFLGVATGLAGALLALIGTPATALTVLLVVLMALAATGALVSPRTGGVRP